MPWLCSIGEIQIQASYYNSQLGAWEPLLEPCVEEEGVYRPYEILFKVNLDFELYSLLLRSVFVF